MKSSSDIKQGLTNLLSGCPGQVRNFAGQLNFVSYLLRKMYVIYRKSSYFRVSLQKLFTG